MTGLIDGRTGVRALRTVLAFSLLLLAAALEAPAYAQDAAPATTTEVTGRLRVVVFDNFESKKSNVRYELKDENTHRWVRLVLPRSARYVGGSNMRVTVRGAMLSGHRLLLEEASVRTLESAAKRANTQMASSLGAQASAAEGAVATRRTIVMVARFQDVGPSCTNAAIDATLFSDPVNGSVDDLYQEMSLGRVGFSGTVSGPFLVDDTASGKCNYDAWTTALNNSATAAGVDLAAYDHRVYVFPGASSCSTGMGTVGGSPGLAWLKACGLPDAFAHELGHNLGMNHASTPDGEYSDVSDVMGYSGLDLRQINAPHQEQMGWRDAASIQTVTTSGTYPLAPLELDATQATAAQTLKIAIPGSVSSYYLSYRRPVGFDANLDSGYYALNVHRYAGNGARTYLLGTYADGQSFVDVASGITVTALSHGTSVLNVSVQLGSAPPACTPGTPTVTIGPSSQSVEAGSQATFTVSLTNTDDANCATSTFALDAGTLPAGWTASPSPASLTLSPGQSSTSTLTVSVASSTATGSYGIGVTVSDAAVGAHTASAGATVNAQATVVPPTDDTTPPTAPQGLVVSARRRTNNMVLTWSASSDDVAVLRYRVWRDGVVVGLSGDTSFIDDSVTDTAMHTYQVTARDAAGNESPPSNSVSAKFGKGGGTTGGGGKPH